MRQALRTCAPPDTAWLLSAAARAARWRASGEAGQRPALRRALALPGARRAVAAERPGGPGVCGALRPPGAGGAKEPALTAPTWMMQIAYNVTIEEWDFFSPGQYHRPCAGHR